MMTTERKRIFVGNLPENASREEIFNKFSKYGTVESVDIKQKKDPTSDEVLSTFSYVNIEAAKVQLDQCVKLLNGIKWDGRHIKVEIAKESFLQQLQRERQANQKIQHAAPPVLHPIEREHTRTGTVTRKRKPEKTDSSSSEESDSENEEIVPMVGGSKLSIQSANEKVTSDHNRPQKSSVDICDSKSPAASNKSKDILKSSESRFKSDDLLKKFESFSDVWKDADEPSSSNNYWKSNSLNRSQNSLSTDRQGSFTKKSIYEENRFQSSSKVSESLRTVPTLSNTVICSAEEKRQKSLDEKRRTFEEQKNAVRLALASSEIHRVNRKVVFDDDCDEVMEVLPRTLPVTKSKEHWNKEYEDQAQTAKGTKQTTQNRNALSLFNDSDNEEDQSENWAKDFRVKKQFEGEKGKKLLELQTRYNNDSRFVLDERFYDSDDENNKKSRAEGRGKDQEPIDSTSEDIAAEREQQLQILSSVLGRPVASTRPPLNNECNTKAMLRFDPTKPNHMKYELTKGETEPKKKKKKKSVTTGNDGGSDGEGHEDEVEEEESSTKIRREEKDPEPVSKDTFYTVADSLADSLKKAKAGQESGFSLLKMFGTPTNEKEVKDSLPIKENPAPLFKGPLRGKSFLDESSEEEREEDEPEPASNIKNDSAFGKSTGGVWQETFFFQPDDSRLKEGADFFKLNEDTDQTADFSVFSKKREELRRIVKMKVRNNTRQVNAFKTKVGDKKRHGSHRPSFGLSSHKRRRK